MLCPFCGSEIADSAVFCDKCGALIESNQPRSNNNGYGGGSDPYSNSNSNLYSNNPNNNYNYQNTQQSAKNGFTTAALVLGIISLFCFGIPCGILGIIFSSVGMAQLSRKNLPTKAGVPGLVISIIGLVGGIAMLWLQPILIDMLGMYY